MQPVLILAVCALLLSSYFFGVSKARALAAPGVKLRARPTHHGFYVLLWSFLPAAALLALWSAASPLVIQSTVLGSLPKEVLETSPNPDVLMTKIENVADTSFQGFPAPEPIEKAAERYTDLRALSGRLLALGLLAVALAGFFYARSRQGIELAAREKTECVCTIFLFVCSCIAVLTTLGIIFSLLFETIRFFSRVPIGEFLFGTKWSPQIAMRADQVASSGAFGAVPLFTGTLLIALIAMFVAVPLGLMSAVFLAEYAGPRMRASAKPVLEILAGIPTVVYGFFAALTVAPWIRDLGQTLGLSVSSESALAAGLVMGVMIIPFISSLSDDVLNAVPQSLRDASYAIGATQSETIKRVVLPAALPGIVGAILLAISRAVGETMIVVMAAGLAANLTLNPLDNVTTVTVQIVTTLVGDQEFDSSKTLSAFALGLTLFCVTLCLNVLALQIVKRYREKYD